MLISRISCQTLIAITLLGGITECFAWGKDGHTAIGTLAVAQLQPHARSELENIIQPGPLDGLAMEEACNWPDVMRNREEWDWSSPLHYVNIPRGDDTYDQSRDCPMPSDGATHPEPRCATEAIKFYANRLNSQQITGLQRWQAFAWVCHLVGDLHQPMHAGFADDQGGNLVEVTFNDAQVNLHRFWDSVLINEQAGNWQNLLDQLSVLPPVQVNSDWSHEMVNDWTSEIHTLTSTPGTMYPLTDNIDEAFAQQSWTLIQAQIRLAAARLALVINSELEPDTGDVR